MINVTSCALGTGVILDGFCALEIPVELVQPRSVRSIGPSDMLVLERGTESIVYLFDSDGDGMPDDKEYIASAPSLNHGLALYDGYVYASSDSTVYRWFHGYEDFEWNFTDPLDDPEIVVDNINRDGQGGAPRGHQTRTLEFDRSGRLYITVGSDRNVDPDSHRSRIRRVPITRHQDFLAPLDFQTLEVFADGVRNTVGLAFDRHDVLWGVENGADNLQREDLGGDITEDNAEELNRFREEDAGSHYGYPYCWTEFLLPEGKGNGTGSVWAWPDFLDQNFTDDQCRNDYVAPLVSLQAHSAPLGIAFYRWSSEVPIQCLGVEAFPQWMDGFAFIAYHGSWNRDVPTGYKVVYIAMNETGDAISSPIDLLAHQPPNARWDDGFRPVDGDFDVCGRLLVTSDGTGNSGSKIVRIEWKGLSCEEPSSSPSTEVPTDFVVLPTPETPSPMPSSSQLSSLTDEPTFIDPTLTPSPGPSCIPTELQSNSPSTTMVSPSERTSSGEARYGRIAILAITQAALIVGISLFTL
ncbi:L-sorbosone dehydrogenase [Nitzschia inconspicua]|uniref:L-sorbosone dehydrogenase n=1 Tax=Nitzschia inconspicua TaxID=303405 RepID=A0A9K3KPQ2_9STRA|nr:L-sorbosone dehydrogenase [Nitzschia inconspicua]